MNSLLIIHKRKNSNTKSTNKYENIILFALAIELSIVRLCWQLFNASFGQIMISFVCLLNSENKPQCGQSLCSDLYPAFSKLPDFIAFTLTKLQFIRLQRKIFKYN